MGGFKAYIQDLVFSLTKCGTSGKENRVSFFFPICTLRAITVTSSLSNGMVQADNTCESPLKRYSLQVVIIIIMPHCTVISSTWAHQPRAPLFVTWLSSSHSGKQDHCGGSKSTIFIITTIILFIISSNSSSVIVNVTVLIITYCFLSTYRATSMP